MINQIIEEINDLRIKRKAVILAHNYQPSEIQDIADYCGDSYQLAKIAKDTAKDVIVFCGVYFMAESAYILNPDKTVLLPDIHAGCGLADMVNEKDISSLKTKYNAPVVTYINSSARTKALSDAVCTSSNCLKVVEKIEGDTVIFVPDKNMAKYIQNNTLKRIIAWPGYCYVHNFLTLKDVLEKKAQHPEAPVLAHPECLEEVLNISDHIFSTSKMIEFAGSYKGKELIICTESGIIFPLKKVNPKINYIFPSNNLICSNMKLITLKKLRDSLKFNQFRINLPEDIRINALKSLNMMLEYGK